MNIQEESCEAGDKEMSNTRAVSKSNILHFIDVSANRNACNTGAKVTNEARYFERCQERRTVALVT